MKRSHVDKRLGVSSSERPAVQTSRGRRNLSGSRQATTCCGSDMGAAIRDTRVVGRTVRCATRVTSSRRPDNVPQRAGARSSELCGRGSPTRCRVPTLSTDNLPLSETRDCAAYRDHGGGRHVKGVRFASPGGEVHAGCADVGALAGLAGVAVESAAQGADTRTVGPRR